MEDISNSFSDEEMEDIIKKYKTHKLFNEHQILLKRNQLNKLIDVKCEMKIQLRFIAKHKKEAHHILKLYEQLKFHQLMKVVRDVTQNEWDRPI